MGVAIQEKISKKEHSSNWSIQMSPGQSTWIFRQCNRFEACLAEAHSHDHRVSSWVFNWTEWLWMAWRCTRVITHTPRPDEKTGQAQYKGTNSLSSQEMERQVKPPGKRNSGPGDGSFQIILDQLQLIDNIYNNDWAQGSSKQFLERVWSKNYEVRLWFVGCELVWWKSNKAVATYGNLFQNVQRVDTRCSFVIICTCLQPSNNNHGQDHTKASPEAGGRNRLKLSWWDQSMSWHPWGSWTYV